MSSYAIVLAPIAAILCADFWVGSADLFNAEQVAHADLQIVKKQVSRRAPRRLIDH
mgnify:CR=1 FL=1